METTRKTEDAGTARAKSEREFELEVELKKLKEEAFEIAAKQAELAVRAKFNTKRTKTAEEEMEALKG